MSRIKIMCYAVYTPKLFAKFFFLPKVYRLGTVFLCNNRGVMLKKGGERNYIYQRFSFKAQGALGKRAQH